MKVIRVVGQRYEVEFVLLDLVKAVFLEVGKAHEINGIMWQISRSIWGEQCSPDHILCADKEGELMNALSSLLQPQEDGFQLELSLSDTFEDGYKVVFRRRS